MTDTTLTLFDRDVSVASSYVDATKEYFRYSGYLDETISLGSSDADFDFAQWIHVTTRDLPVTVTITYTSDPPYEFEVYPGIPLHFLTPESRTVSEVQVAAATPTGNQPYVEVLILESGVELNPDSAPYLVLDGRSGITEDSFDPGKVDSWKDTRYETLAPLDFNLAFGFSEKPQVVNDDMFNGQPVVDFSTGVDAWFQYSGAPFEFIEPGSAFTVLMVFSSADNSETFDYANGLWTSNSSGGGTGFDAAVEGGNRIQTDGDDGSSTTTDLQADELVDKPTIAIWRYDGSDLRVYWQGRWQDAVSVAGPATGSEAPFGVGYSYQFSNPYMRGKIANITVYNRAVDQATWEQYISDAVETWGVDDTEQQGFPLVADAVNYHRSTRGVDYAGVMNSIVSWKDTRVDYTANSENLNAANFPSYELSDSLFNDYPSLEMNGSSNALINANSGAWDHLAAGGNGMTIVYIIYSTGTQDPIDPIVFQDLYGSATLSGVNIMNTNGVPDYELDNGSNQDLVAELGETQVSDRPYLTIFSADSSAFKITEVNLTTGDINEIDGTVSNTPANTAGSLTLSASTDLVYFNEMNWAEFITFDTVISDENRQKVIDYARRRYANA